MAHATAGTDFIAHPTKLFPRRGSGKFK